MYLKLIVLAIKSYKSVDTLQSISTDKGFLPEWPSGVVCKYVGYLPSQWLEGGAGV